MDGLTRAEIFDLMPEPELDTKLHFKLKNKLSVDEKLWCYLAAAGLL